MTATSLPNLETKFSMLYVLKKLISLATGKFLNSKFAETAGVRRFQNDALFNKKNFNYILLFFNGIYAQMSYREIENVPRCDENLPTLQI